MNMHENSRGLRVLVVDDERAIADSLARILVQVGFDATAVYSGEAACDKAQALKPDVLVCDVMLTGISGVEAALEICRLLPNCRVILITGQLNTGEIFDRAKCLPSDFDLIRKPFHPEELIARLNGD